MLTNSQDDGGCLSPVKSEPTAAAKRRNTEMPHLVPRAQVKAAKPLLIDVQNATDFGVGEQSRDDLFALSMLVHASAGLPGHIVTIGAGQGCAAAVLGHAARAAGRSRVFAVDLFPDSDDAPDDVTWSLDAFLQTMTECGLLENVLPHHGTGASFARLMPNDFRARLLLLASAHACADVASDILALERFLTPGGWLCIDASFSSFPGAATALETLLRQRNHFDLRRQITPTLFVARKRPTAI
jgi:hypothetical protein